MTVVLSFITCTFHLPCTYPFHPPLPLVYLQASVTLLHYWIFNSTTLILVISFRTQFRLQ